MEGAGIGLSAGEGAEAGGDGEGGEGLGCKAEDVREGGWRCGVRAWSVGQLDWVVIGMALRGALGCVGLVRIGWNRIGLID